MSRRHEADERQPGAAAEGRRAGLEPGEREDDRPVQHLLHGRRRVQDREQRIEHGEDQSAQDRPAVTAASAEIEVPPMTTAATEGSRKGAAIPRSAASLNPTRRIPATALNTPQSA